ncbi:hypothetical protein EDEG_02510 [Edhazardia aedis USNM 41457]|uniref:Uncharacterized protein n=1 Tax=Edhazardia aedis (strain USNM 41457) TaxID=1003232 RepID=J9DP42_EDHAE|nr:hypothetical protein EDEG_02510 [Edhazardia aedis USNM 41457]|eukprot:EJW03102.1 hypothetical protein EDEG_02510 [Edhazardia aedis USNM 41457]
MSFIKISVALYSKINYNRKHLVFYLYSGFFSLINAGITHDAALDADFDQTTGILSSSEESVYFDALDHLSEDEECENQEPDQNILDINRSSNPPAYISRSTNTFTSQLQSNDHLNKHQFSRIN